MKCEYDMPRMKANMAHETRTTKGRALSIEVIMFCLISFRLS